MSTDPTPIARLVGASSPSPTLLFRSCACTTLPGRPHNEDTVTVGDYTVEYSTDEHRGPCAYDGDHATFIELVITITDRRTDNTARLVLGGADFFRASRCIRVLAGHERDLPHREPTRARWVASAMQTLTDLTRWSRSVTLLPDTSPDGPEAHLVTGLSDVPAWLLAGFSTQRALAPYKNAGISDGLSAREWLHALTKADVLAWAPHVVDPTSALVLHATGWHPHEACQFSRHPALNANTDLLAAMRQTGWSATDADALHRLLKDPEEQAKDEAVRIAGFAAQIAPAAAPLALAALEAGMREGEIVRGISDGTLTSEGVALLVALQ